MLNVCPDCHGIPDFFDSPCPTCGDKGGIGSFQSEGSRRQNEQFQALMKTKLASSEWEDMVQWTRKQVGLPPQGLDPEHAQEFFLGALMNLLLSCRVVHPKLGPQLMEQSVTQLPEAMSDVPDDVIERGVRAILSSAPNNLVKLRFAAAHLASWLGIEEENAVMFYLVSSDRWRLWNISPKKQTKSGPTQFPAIVSILSSLLPLPRSQQVIKGILLRGFVKGLRTILPKIDGEQLRWEDIAETWNALFPEWRYGHWRHMKKAHDNSVKRREQ